MVQQYSSQAPIPVEQKPLAPIGMARFAGTEGMQSLGNSIKEIGRAQMEIRISRDIADGMAQRNAMVGAFKQSLLTKDPRSVDFNAEYQKLETETQKLLAGKSRAAQDELSNRFTLLNSEDRLNVAYTAFQREKQLILDEIPSLRKQYAILNRPDLWEKEVNGWISRGLFVPEQKKVLMAEYNDEAQKANKDRAKDALSSQVSQLAETENSWDKALEFMATPKNRNQAMKQLGITSEEYDSIFEDIKTLAAYREATEKKTKDAQIENNCRQLLADIWDGKITDPNIVTQMMREKTIDETSAKEMRKALLNPEPIETKAESYVKAKDSIISARLGDTSRQEALKTIMSLSNSISAIDGKSLINELYADLDRQEDEAQKQAYKYIDDTLLQQDMFGRIIGDSTSFKNAAEAKVILSAEMKKLKKSAKDGIVPAGAYLQSAYKITQMDRFKDQTLATSKDVSTPPSGLEPVWSTMNELERKSATQLLKVKNPQTGKAYTAQEIINILEK